LASTTKPTGAPTGFRSDVVATAKKPLKSGEMLDGEGGFTVWGRLMEAGDSVNVGAVPIGLAHGLKLKHRVKQGAALQWSDVELREIENSAAYRLRREMEAVFAPPPGKARVAS